MTNTPEKIEECLVEHLPYEIGMLRLAMDIILKADGDGTPMNIGIELFCLHARNLIEFFKNEADFKPDEFTIKEYQRPRRPFFSDQTCQRIANEITHLTRHRFIQTHKKITNLNCIDFYRILESEIGRFGQALAPDKKPKWRTLYPPIQLPPEAPPSSATNAIQVVSSTATFSASFNIISSFDPQ